MSLVAPTLVGCNPQIHLFHPSSLRPFAFDHGTGHFSQLIWADTERVGCGFIYYYHDGGPFPYQQVKEEDPTNIQGAHLE